MTETTTNRIRLGFPPATERQAERTALALVTPETSVAGAIALPLRPLGEPRAELWTSSGSVELVESDVAEGLRTDGMHLMGALRAPEGPDLEKATRRLYESLLAEIERLRFPYLLRIWNYFPRINEVETIERYREFCIGRYDAFLERGYAMAEDLPAGSAVGSHGGDLLVIFMASRERPRTIENPRQVSAFSYPERYGPRSPSFARGSLLADEKTLLISGTASIVGHESLHGGNVEAQVDETLRNLDAVIERAFLPGASLSSSGVSAWLKVYVRHPEDRETIARKLEGIVPEERISWLEADICRSDLLVEIEAFVVRE